MNETATETRTCPYLNPNGDAPLRGSLVAVYCRRAGGRVRIPSRDEIERFCASGHHLDCPGYRRARLEDMCHGG